MTTDNTIYVEQLPFDQMTNWEIHLLEDAIGVGMDRLDEFAKSDKPKHIFYIALIWLKLRRTMGKELTLEQVGEGPWELTAAEGAAEALAQEVAAADPLEPSDDESTTDGPGESSSTPTTGSPEASPGESSGDSPRSKKKRSSKS